MANNHIIPKNIGNLRGFSTDSIFTRPPNVATVALNLQRAPDGTLQLRRGYQCQIGQIGGMGIGTFDDTSDNVINVVTVGMDGFLYHKLQKQIFLNYNGQITGAITGVTDVGGIVNIVSDGHGLQTGAQIIIRNTTGAPQLDTVNETYDMNYFTITVVDANNFTLNGIAYSSLDPAYMSDGTWSIYFADARYLTLSIFVDPRFLNAPTNQSITCDFIINRAAQINGNQNLVNTINVQFGNTIPINANIQFYDVNGVMHNRVVTATSPTSLTISGTPVSVRDTVFINQFVQFIFGKGFDVVSVYTIQTFINTATSMSNGVQGLTIACNGDQTYPAAFIQILESVLIPSGTTYTLDYWYWYQVNSTITPLPPFPGSANPTYQNSQSFENSSMAAYDDVIYVANGWDYPQKYDGQTVYRAGLPIGQRTSNSDNTGYLSTPFVSGNNYQYATTFEQVDARGHVLEGEISQINKYEAGSTCACNVLLTNLQSQSGQNWNTNTAKATGGQATVYGPDSNGYYYDLVAVSTGYTLKIGDSAYYGDTTAAIITGSATSITLPVNEGNAIVPGDIVYFFDNAMPPNQYQRVVSSIDTDSNTITIVGDPVSVDTTNPNILAFKTSLVFGNVAIATGTAPELSDINIIPVKTGYSIAVDDVVEFIDIEGNLQRRNVTVVGTPSNTITIDSLPVTLNDNTLIAATNQASATINLRRLNSVGATLSDGTTGNIPNVISNNLRINIYRTLQGQEFGPGVAIQLVASVPNDGSGVATQTYIDGLADTELGAKFSNPLNPPNPPPISKYLKCFGNQMFYAGGERGNPENSDRVFFSGFSGLIPVENPEVVPLATNSFSVPNVDDEITGIGVSGSTLITTKNNSLWGATGNFFTGQIEVIQIAPGTNIGCVCHASIAAVGTLMYFLHTNGVYAITENQLFPTDAFGNPIPISLPIDKIFRETNYLPWTKYVLKRAVACNYTKENQYLLFLPCEDSQATIRTANANSILLAYDHEAKNWFKWDNMNAAGGMYVDDDNLYFQERRYSGVNGNTANLYKQHRFYRLIDHADHAGPQNCEWLSSWEDLGQPEVRKKFSRCVLLMDRISDLGQYNNPIMKFSTYLNRLPDLQNTIATISPVDNIRNAGWGTSPWGWNYWSGYQDSFVAVNLKQGTVAKSIQVGFKITGINTDIRLSGFQLEIIPENRKTMTR